MPFGDPQFIQHMHSLGLSPTMSAAPAAGDTASSQVLYSPPPAQTADNIPPNPALYTPPPLRPAVGPSPVSFQVPALRRFDPSSAAPIARPYAQYGGPEQTYFSGNTLQNFGWPGPANPGNQAAAAAETPPVPAASGGGDSPGNMATGGRVKPKRLMGALNALAKTGGL